MRKGLIAYVAIIIIMVIIWYLSTGFKTSLTSTTSTVAPSNSVKSTVATTTTNSSFVYYPCNNFSLFNSSINSTVDGKCYWTGGTLGLWLAGGNPGKARAVIKSASNQVIMNISSQQSCIAFYGNFSAPAGVYNVILSTGNSHGNCGYAILRLNSTIVPPSQIYNFIYNGNFGTGHYTGWNVTGKGFGAKPLNITYANSNASRCYLGQPWSNYNGTFFATTFNCGTSVSPGNLTSSLFYANSPFLNFKIISPAENGLYVEILYKGSPAIVAHFNTFNSSAGAKSSSTFANATIPLTTVIGKPVQIRVVANTLEMQRFIAVGDFVLSSTPLPDSIQPLNITFS
ncbi:MAG: hypothetical protein ACP5SJ_00155 [Candidatus Micrarchaeia archaeon]